MEGVKLYPDGAEGVEAVENEVTVPVHVLAI
jgi:hypothetical protein